MCGDDIYAVRDHDGNIRIFIGAPILVPKFKEELKTEIDFYGEKRTYSVKTDEYLYDEWINPIYLDDKFDRRRFGFVVDEKCLGENLRDLDHISHPIKISK